MKTQLYWFFWCLDEGMTSAPSKAHFCVNGVVCGVRPSQPSSCRGQSFPVQTERDVTSLLTLFSEGCWLIEQHWSHLLKASYITKLLL